MKTYAATTEGTPSSPITVLLNASRADLYDQCPLAYYHRWVARDLPTPSSPALKRGTDTHRILALYNRAYMQDGAQPDPDTFLRDLWHGHVASSPEADALRDYIDASIRGYAHYCALWGLRPVAVEQTITLPARPLATNTAITLTLNGRIDAILHATHNSPLLPEGAYFACDFKASAVALTQEMRAAPSTTIYLLLAAYWMKRPATDLTVGQFSPRFEEDVRVGFDEVELEAGRAHLRTIAEGMAQSKWGPRVCALCDHCDVQRQGRCPLQCAREVDTNDQF